MKFSSDIGPQVQPANYGAEVVMKPKGEDFSGPQINYGPPTGSGENVFTRPGQYGGVTRVAHNTRRGFFPAATGLPGEPSVRRVDAFQGGPGGSMNNFGVRRSWTWF